MRGNRPDSLASAPIIAAFEELIGGPSHDHKLEDMTPKMFADAHTAVEKLALTCGTNIGDISRTAALKERVAARSRLDQLADQCNGTQEQIAYVRQCTSRLASEIVQESQAIVLDTIVTALVNVARANIDMKKRLELLEAELLTRPKAAPAAPNAG